MRLWAGSPDILQLLTDAHNLALLSGSSFASYSEDLAWLTYHLQDTNLVLMACVICIAFYDKCDILSLNNGKSLYNDSQSPETCAEFLLLSMKMSSELVALFQMRRRQEGRMPGNLSPLICQH